jgi:hypothetical protein
MLVRLLRFAWWYLRELTGEGRHDHAGAGDEAPGMRCC